MMMTTRSEASELEVVDVVDVRALDERRRACWRALQKGNEALASPYFSIEFTEAVTAVRDDVRVAVLRARQGRGQEAAGFFPFQRGPANACEPVGGIVSDHHGVIAQVNATWSWRALLEATGLAFWRFDHLVAAQARSVNGAARCASPAIDVTAGFDAWRARKLASGSRLVNEVERKARKLAREVGPLRFEAMCDWESPHARAVLEQVIAQKSAQCVRTGARDYFALEPWTRALVTRLAAMKGVELSGALSALWAGDVLVAANMGMRSERVWHWWFPIYHHAFAPYSPGSILLLRVAEAAAQRGASMIDLGKGSELYKERFADTSVPIAEGFIAQRSLLNLGRVAADRFERWFRASSYFPALRPALVTMRSAMRSLRAS